MWAMSLVDPVHWSAAALAVAVVALALGQRRLRADLAREERRRVGLEATHRASYERTAAELTTAAKGLLGNVSAVTETSAQAVESVRSTAGTMTELTHTAMTAAVSAETVIGLARQSERAADEALAALAELEVAMAAAEPGRGAAGAELVRRTGTTIRTLAAALREAAGAARNVATIAEQQGAKFDEVQHAMNAIYLATEKSLASTEQVAREARSLDELASSLRRTGGRDRPRA
jgi:hypothetical protein